MRGNIRIGSNPATRKIALNLAIYADYALPNSWDRAERISPSRSRLGGFNAAERMRRQILKRTRKLLMGVTAMLAVLSSSAHAQFTDLLNPNGQTRSISGITGTITVPEYCETDDVTVSITEPPGTIGYYVRIAEFDPTTWRDTIVYNDDWRTVSGGAPNTYNLNGYSPWLNGLGFEPNKVYRAYTEFNTGLQAENEVFAVRSGPCGGSVTTPDGATDFFLLMPQSNTWRVRTSSSGFSANVDTAFGQLGDVPLPRMDVDNDGVDDPVVWRTGPQARFFWIASSGTGTVSSRQWGTNGDVPIHNVDANLDGRDDLIVWRDDPNGGVAFVINSATNQLLWNRGLGQSGDQVVQDIDLDGDGNNDLATWNNNGDWSFRLSGEGFANAYRRNWGTAGDIPLGGMNTIPDAGDELAVWRPGPTGTLFTVNHTGGMPRNFAIGRSGDVPVTGSDFDGDGLSDPAVWRVDTGGNGEFHWRPNSGGATQVVMLGMTGDTPIQGADFNGDGATDFSVFRPQNGRWLARNLSNSWTLDEAVGDGQPGQVAGHGIYE